MAWFVLSKEDIATIKLCIGLIILVFIHAIYLILGYWLIEKTDINSFIVMVIIISFGDIVAVILILVKRIFKISAADMDKIKVDDIPK